MIEQKLGIPYFPEKKDAKDRDNERANRDVF
jgi:hypothetical protein